MWASREQDFSKRKWVGQWEWSHTCSVFPFIQGKFIEHLLCARRHESYEQNSWSMYSNGRDIDNFLKNVLDTEKCHKYKLKRIKRG